MSCVVGFCCVICAGVLLSVAMFVLWARVALCFCGGGGVLVCVVCVCAVWFVCDCCALCLFCACLFVLVV